MAMEMVRMTGFDPATSWTRTTRSTRLSYILFEIRVGEVRHISLSSRLCATTALIRGSPRKAIGQFTIILECHG